MLLLEDQTEAVTAVEAARMLDRQPSSIRCWATRYGARQLGKIGKAVYYDFMDLAVIERELAHGCKVPPTVEERAAIRSHCPLAVAA